MARRRLGRWTLARRLTAGAFLVFGAWMHGRLYAAGFSKAQEGQERKEGRARSRGLDRVFAGAKPSTRELVEKEIRVFFRDTTQWSQLILLAVLVVVYVYNIVSLPLHTGEEVGFLLTTVVSFLNLGLAGFVVAAIAARFVFPAMSVEGRVMWLLRSSPLRVRDLFVAKYWVGTIPLLVVALPLILTTNLVMETPPLILLLTTVTMIGATFALTAMALGLGALFPNFDTENVAEIPTSFGGLLFMMCAVLYLGAVVALEGWPVYAYLQSRMAGGSVSAWTPTLGFGGAVLLTVLAVWLPLRTGMRELEAGDIHDV